MTADITLSLQEEQGAVIIETQDEQTVIFDFSDGQGGDPYGGEYEVVPSFSAKTLPTRDKRLLNDITIHSIPVSRTSNPAGGKTIYIGEV